MSKNVKFTYEDGSTIVNPIELYQQAASGSNLKAIEIIEEESFAVECVQSSGWWSPVVYKKLENITLEYLRYCFNNGRCNKVIITKSK